MVWYYTAYMVHEKDLERRPLRYAIIVMVDPSEATETDERQHHTPTTIKKQYVIGKIFALSMCGARNDA